MKSSTCVLAFLSVHNVGIVDKLERPVENSDDKPCCMSSIFKPILVDFLFRTFSIYYIVFVDDDDGLPILNHFGLYPFN